MESNNKKTVLVVDDDEVILEVIKSLLEKHGYNVLTATEYEETLEIVNTHTLDLMLLDIMMPNVDGTAILQITKKSAYLEKSFPIIYVSAKPKDNVNLEDSDGFIQKPFKSKEFIDYIQKILKEWPKKEK